MLKRKIDSVFEDFLSDSSKKALLVTGARQVGKTYSVRQFGNSHFDSFVEFNFIKNEESRTIFRNVSDEKDILLRISALSDKPLVPGKTLIFFDEVQVCPEAITHIKFLVEEGSYRYILSGSLLGVELKNIRSVPVGYMTEAQMFPLDFEEFIRANGTANDVIEHLRNSFENRQSPDPVVHAKMMRYHSLYLVTGGMPAVVQKYLDTNDLRKVQAEQSAIVREYKRDITQYDERLKMRLRHIFDIMPSELNKHNKRFFLKKSCVIRDKLLKLVNIGFAVSFGKQTNKLVSLAKFLPKLFIVSMPPVKAFLKVLLIKVFVCLDKFVISFLSFFGRWFCGFIGLSLLDIACRFNLGLLTKHHVVIFSGCLTGFGRLGFRLPLVSVSAAHSSLTAGGITAVKQSKVCLK